MEPFWKIVRLYRERVIAGWMRWNNEWQQSGDGIMSGSRVEEMA
jgi:hypothetical protein